MAQFPGGVEINPPNSAVVPGLQNAVGIYSQIKNLQAQHEQLQQQKQLQTVTIGMSMLPHLPDTLKVKALNKMAPTLSKMSGLEFPQFSEDDMQDKSFANMIDGFKQIDAMKGPDGKPLDEKSKLFMKRPLAADYLNKRGKPTEAVRELLSDAPGQNNPIPIMKKGEGFINPLNGEPIVYDPTKKYQVINDPSTNPNLGIREETLLAKNTQTLAKRIEDMGTPEAITQFKTISSLIPKEGNVPGYGRAESLVPSFLLSDEGRALRQAVQGLQNVKIKDRSGAAVTPPEFVRLREEFGTGKLKTVEQLRQGLNQAVSAYRERVRNAFAGFDENTKSEYLSRNQMDNPLDTLSSFDFGGKTGGALQNSANQIMEIKSDAEYKKLPSGSNFKGPDGKIRVKP